MDRKDLEEKSKIKPNQTVSKFVVNSDFRRYTSPPRPFRCSGRAALCKPKSDLLPRRQIKNRT